MNDKQQQLQELESSKHYYTVHIKELTKQIADGDDKIREWYEKERPELLRRLFEYRARLAILEMLPFTPDKNEREE